MRISTILLSVALVFFFVSQGMAQNTAIESFNYSSGAFLDSLGTAGNGWGGPWKIDTTNAKFDSMCVVTDTGFNYTDLDYSVPHIGNNATLSLPGGWSKSARYKRPLASTWPDVAGQYWVSFLFDTKGDPSLDGGNSYLLFKLYSGSGYYSGTELTAIGKGGGAVNYSCGSGWPGSATAPGESNTVDQGGPVWLVAMINMTGDATKDAAARIFMWINPDPSTTPDTNNANATNTINISNGIGAVGIECGGQDTIQIGYDEIRLGTSFDDVSSALTTPGYLASESFNYTAGSKNYIDNLNGGSGWAGPWTKTSDAANDSLTIISDTGIAYGDMNYTVPHTGNLALGVTGAGQEDRFQRQLDKTWPATAGATYWLSFAMQLKSDTNSNSWSGIKLFNGTGGELLMYGKGYASDVYTVGSGYQPDATAPTASSVGWDSGPVWIVGELVLSGDPNVQDVAYMWVNPDPTVTPDTNYADAKASVGISSAGGFNYVRITFGGSPAYQVAFDEIRLGTSFTDVSSPLTKVIAQNSNVPHNFTLSQNYPNPFNPTTSINYSLTKSGKVRLAVYDLLGREVSVLVNQEQAPGNYEVSFNGENLASGIYFYRLQAGNKMITKKMILMK